MLFLSFYRKFVPFDSKNSKSKQYNCSRILQFAALYNVHAGLLHHLPPILNFWNPVILVKRFKLEPLESPTHYSREMENSRSCNFWCCLEFSGNPSRLNPPEIFPRFSGAVTFAHLLPAAAVCSWETLVNKNRSFLAFLICSCGYIKTTK